jgi:hypothetical protein
LFDDDGGDDDEFPPLPGSACSIEDTDAVCCGRLPRMDSLLNGEEDEEEADDDDDDDRERRLGDDDDDGDDDHGAVPVPVPVPAPPSSTIGGWEDCVVAVAVAAVVEYHPHPFPATSDNFVATIIEYDLISMIQSTDNKRSNTFDKGELFHHPKVRKKMISTIVACMNNSRIKNVAMMMMIKNIGQQLQSLGLNAFSISLRCEMLGCVGYYYLT